MDEATNGGGIDGGGDDNVQIDLKLQGGLFAATLEDADKVEIRLRGDAERAKTFRQCTILAADRDAVLARDATGTLLIPREAISYVRLHWDQENIERLRQMWGRSIPIRRRR